MKLKSRNEFDTRKNEFVEQLSLIGIKYQPAFHTGDKLSNHYTFDLVDLTVVKFEFKKDTYLPPRIGEECQKLFNKFFK